LKKCKPAWPVLGEPRRPDFTRLQLDVFDQVSKTTMSASLAPECNEVKE
jgi:hypothetical protein